MISKTHISGQKPRGRQLNVKVCGHESAIFRPTHTDRYLHFESHHPTHVKRGVVRCLHDRAREIISTQDNLSPRERVGSGHEIQKEVDHLISTQDNLEGS